MNNFSKVIEVINAAMDAPEGPTYQPRGLSIFGYSNGITMWNYVTTDYGGYVFTPGYFFDPTLQLRVGDWIFARWRDGAGLLFVSELTPAKAATVVPIGYARLP